MLVEVEGYCFVHLPVSKGKESMTSVFSVIERPGIQYQYSAKYGQYGNDRYDTQVEHGLSQLMKEDRLTFKQLLSKLRKEAWKEATRNARYETPQVHRWIRFEERDDVTYVVQWAAHDNEMRQEIPLREWWYRQLVEVVEEAPTSPTRA